LATNMLVRIMLRATFFATDYVRPFIHDANTETKER
jgi:hypothetical protein